MTDLKYDYDFENSIGFIEDIMRNIQSFPQDSSVRFNGHGWVCPIHDVNDRQIGLAIGATQQEAVERAHIFAGASITEMALEESVKNISSALELLCNDNPELKASSAVKLLQCVVSSNGAALRGVLSDDSTAVKTFATISTGLTNIIANIQSGGCAPAECLSSLIVCLNHANRMLDQMRPE